MKTTLYILEGENVVRVKTTKGEVSTLASLGPNVRYAVSTGSDGEFGEWQIARLLEQLKP